MHKKYRNIERFQGNVLVKRIGGGRKLLANVPTRNDYEDARCSLGLTVTGIGFHWAHWNWDFMKVLMKVLMKAYEGAYEVTYEGL